MSSRSGFEQGLLTLGGVGHLKPGPGTWGSLVALLAAVSIGPLSPILWVAAGLLMSLVAWLLCARLTAERGDVDPPEVVLDEFVGLWWSLTAVPHELIPLGIAFLCFRLFDIWKPGPVGWLDRHCTGGLGILADDVVAGVLACLCTQLWLWAVAASA
jgi:phosphatidylglycerophosphatase A